MLLLLKLPFCHLRRSVFRTSLFFVSACLHFTVATGSWEGTLPFVIYVSVSVF